MDVIPAALDVFHALWEGGLEVGENVCLFLRASANLDGHTRALVLVEIGGVNSSLELGLQILSSELNGDGLPTKKLELEVEKG